MSREIKFRGKAVDNGEWIYGYYWANKTATRETSHIVDEYGDMYQVAGETVGQYVEILDAYEGDVVYGCDRDEYGHLMSSWLGQVKYNESKSRIMVYDIYQGDWYEVDDYMADKVIGNVFDHPEMLGVE